MLRTSSSSDQEYITDPLTVAAIGDLLSSATYSWSNEDAATAGGVSTTYSWSDGEDAATAVGVSTTYFWSDGDGSGNIDHDAAVSGGGVEPRESE